jgi:transposase
VIIRYVALRRVWNWILCGQEVVQFYGIKGNISEDPVVIMKMMLLLFLDNVRSERELIRIIPERLDYMWFLGYGLDDIIPNHSVLSKARKRWGKEVLVALFSRIVAQCVRAGLVEGTKIHADTKRNPARRLLWAKFQATAF